MNEKDTGGPAFPSNGSMGEVVHEGMTLRDHFAAKAMQVDYKLATKFADPEWRYGVALEAYKMADAMLKARKK